MESDTWAETLCKIDDYENINEEIKVLKIILLNKDQRYILYSQKKIYMLTLEGLSSSMEHKCSMEHEYPIEDISNAIFCIMYSNFWQMNELEELIKIIDELVKMKSDYFENKEFVELICDFLFYLSTETSHPMFLNFITIIGNIYSIPFRYPYFKKIILKKLHEHYSDRYSKFEITYKNLLNDDTISFIRNDKELRECKIWNNSINKTHLY